MNIKILRVKMNSQQKQVKRSNESLENEIHKVLLHFQVLEKLDDQEMAKLMIKMALLFNDK